METKYSTISTVNGTFTIDAEHGTDLKAAFVFFFGRVQALWSDVANIQSAVVQVVDSNMNVVKEERISPIVLPVNDVPAKNTQPVVNDVSEGE
jgi:hypothetical protein